MAWCYRLIKNNSVKIYWEDFKRLPYYDVNNEFTNIIIRSVEENTPIRFDLNNDKVYVGYLTGDYTKNSGDLNIIPLRSGYRDARTRAFIGTENYMESVEKFLYIRFLEAQLKDRKTETSGVKKDPIDYKIMFDKEVNYLKTNNVDIYFECLENRFMLSIPTRSIVAMSTYDFEVEYLQVFNGNDSKDETRKP